MQIVVSIAIIVDPSYTRLEGWDGILGPGCATLNFGMPCFSS